MTEPTIQTAFRLPEGLLARVDAYAEQLKAERPGLPATRADAVRVLLTLALDQVEGGRRKPTPKPEALRVGVR